MKQRRRIYYTDSQKALMWERWCKGESLQQIAQLFDRNHSSIHGILAETGGIQPKQRHRSRLALTLAEREEISRSMISGVRFAQLRINSDVLCRPLAASSSGTEVCRAIGRAMLTNMLGNEPVAHKSVSSSRTANLPRSWQASSGCSGRPSRSPVGLSTCTRSTGTIRCRTRPYTAASTYKLVVRSKRNCSSIYPYALNRKTRIAAGKEMDYWRPTRCRPT